MTCLEHFYLVLFSLASGSLFGGTIHFHKTPVSTCKAPPNSLPPGRGCPKKGFMRCRNEREEHVESNKRFPGLLRNFFDGWRSDQHLSVCTGCWLSSAALQLAPLESPERLVSNQQLVPQKRLDGVWELTQWHMEQSLYWKTQDLKWG